MISELHRCENYSLRFPDGVMRWLLGPQVDLSFLYCYSFLTLCIESFIAKKQSVMATSLLKVCDYLDILDYRDIIHYNCNLLTLLITLLAVDYTVYLYQLSNY